eukprot:3842932-Rhodomonas_salina.1
MQPPTFRVQTVWRLRPLQLISGGAVGGAYTSRRRKACQTPPGPSSLLSVSFFELHDAVGVPHTCASDKTKAVSI